MMDIKEVLLLWFINILIKKKSAGGAIKQNETKQNEQLAEELPKSIIKKIEKIKVYSLFKSNTCGADLTDM